MTAKPEHQADDNAKPEEEPSVEDASIGAEMIEGVEMTAEEASAAQAAAASGFANPVEFLSAELDKAEVQKAELTDNYLRAHAEMENLRRRTQRDVADARAYSIAGFAREMLGVADNLRRALDAVPEDAADNGAEGLKSLIEGVEMTERSMMQALEKHGVKKITPLNERFDPNLHQAMFEISNADVQDKTVMEVVQDGFVIGERCLRPAMVGVSKGGPKQPTQSEETAEASESEE